MGYSVYYKPPKEMVDELKSSADVESTYSLIKSEIIKTCMENIENIFQFQTIINRCLKNIYNISKTDAEMVAYSQFQEDGEIGFYGWDKARDSIWEDINELYKVNYNSLFIIAIVKTPDFFTEKDKYYEKYEEICEIIDGLYDSCFTYAQRELMEKFKEYKNE